MEENTPRPALPPSTMLGAMSRHVRETVASCILVCNRGIDCSGSGNGGTGVRLWAYGVGMEDGEKSVCDRRPPPLHCKMTWYRASVARRHESSIKHESMVVVAQNRNEFNRTEKPMKNKQQKGRRRASRVPPPLRKTSPQRDSRYSG